MKTEILTRSEVQQRNQDWIARVAALYNQVDTWRQRLPIDLKVIRDEAIQRPEELLREYDLAPQTISTYTLIYKTIRMAFVPAGLWIIGANGRINITTNRIQYILLDFSSPLAPSPDWRIVSPEKAEIHPEFDENAFRGVCMETFGVF